MISSPKKEPTTQKKPKVKNTLSPNPSLPEEIIKAMSTFDITYKKFNEVQLFIGDVIIFGEEGYSISQIKNTEIFFTRRSSIKMEEYSFGFIERVSCKSYYICKLKEAK